MVTFFSRSVAFKLSFKSHQMTISFVQNDKVFTQMMMISHLSAREREREKKELEILRPKCQNKKQFVRTTCSEHVLSLQFSCTELVIQ